MSRINSKVDRVYPVDYLFKKVEDLTNLIETEVVETKSIVEGMATQFGYIPDNKLSYAYNANGDIQTVTEKDKNNVVISTTTYTYKANGDVDTSVKVAGSQTLTTQYIYDSNGNLTDTITTKS